MALALPTGLTPSEVAFVSEMELVTVIPRQRLEGLDLLGGPTAPLQPPYRAVLPLWLALLLKRQRRANIHPPPWLNSASLEVILREENASPSFSPAPPLPPNTNTPPFLPSATADASERALPFHWLEIAELLLDAAPDDIPEPDSVRRLMRDLREVRMAKIRAGSGILEGGGEVKMNGVGGMEVSEGRAFICGAVDGLRKVGASKELSRKEKEAEERENGIGDQDQDEDDMDI